MTIDEDNGINCHMIYGLYENVNVAGFQRYLLDSVDILSYWNHVPLIYFVKTKLDTNELTVKLQDFFNKNLFVVAEIDPMSISGWLPMHSWDWFRTPAPLYKLPSNKLTYGQLLSGIENNS
ncbi:MULTISPECIES: hypothetical protein [Rhizobium]|uniref:CdiI C-terminal domain-containing protein n=1 Tax=Rhizobium rhododendri TaxID=2506430 RepID=A0ABY8IF52_9HYPH|nr:MULTISPECIES: hypothetical protein [Rhizobium]MBZ5760950.1 hypothetical protein [Rhizobium sp. VS19-DR96]MBZ5765266.1 hypothetical protein [Rhizobium sp. VS19-DR129.2]MBZ5774771.1 hypothetical protein [Rhizobium sp. VS19-DRK62.2]MBZ5784785.1 hypothetical protein [Rhizobium sp. VS19-DR121]MBZ5801397.1 hypothetical protein [Rhizobium sp. VS19-DR181]